MTDKQANPSLTAEAERALKEAKERHELRGKDPSKHPKEILGRKGPEPTRYGDWEKDGIISDF